MSHGEAETAMAWGGSGCRITGHANLQNQCWKKTIAQENAGDCFFNGNDGVKPLPFQPEI